MDRGRSVSKPKRSQSYDSKKTEKKHKKKKRHDWELTGPLSCLSQLNIKKFLSVFGRGGSRIFSRGDGDFQKILKILSTFS